MNQPACLLTGASGFLGRYLNSGLASAGYAVTGLCRRRPDCGSWVEASLTSLEANALEDARYELVVHAAGLAHFTPRTTAEQRLFHLVNTQGLRNLLDALSRQPARPKRFVLISTVAVYGRTGGELLDEITPLQASDPYGSSKLAAERLVLDWAENAGVRVCILRLPLVFGENPPGNLGAMSEAIRRGRYAGIRPGKARRSVVSASDVAAIVPRAAELGGVFHLTDGAHPSFRELELAFARSHGVRPPHALPQGLARLCARAGDALQMLGGDRVPLNTSRFEKMTSTLTFDDRRARTTLGWNPTPVLSLI
ncbi:MAG: NAD-dependent epimerase/dehydratase family protein [Bryobacteraceae bacterium]|nr:NAD-dependent epimerase/dehydratase family protein [Bryobacteraceae bacterium]